MHSHKRLSQFTMLCKGDMSQHSKTAFTKLSLAPSKSIYNEILFKIWALSNIFQVFKMASLVRASL